MRRRRNLEIVSGRVTAGASPVLEASSESVTLTTPQTGWYIITIPNFRLISAVVIPILGNEFANVDNYTENSFRVVLANQPATANVWGGFSFIAVGR